MTHALWLREQWEMSLALLQQVEGARLQCDVVLATAAIAALQRASRWQHALELLALMCARCLANEHSFTAAIGACEAAELARSRVGEMEKGAS